MPRRGVDHPHADAACLASTTGSERSFQPFSRSSRLDCVVLTSVPSRVVSHLANHWAWVTTLPLVGVAATPPSVSAVEHVLFELHDQLGATCQLGLSARLA